jgi:hypothetical protein
VKQFDGLQGAGSGLEFGAPDQVGTRAYIRGIGQIGLVQKDLEPCLHDGSFFKAAARSSS